MPRPSSKNALIIVLILLAAAMLRLAALTRIPPGLPFEEAILAEQALNQPLPFAPGGTWAAALISGSMALFGQNLLGIRFPAVLCGLLTIGFTFRWAGLVWSRRVGFIAAALLAISFWPLYFSRIGLEGITLPPLAALSCWLIARGIAGRSTVSMGLAGLAAGAAIASPPGGWLLIGVFALFYAWLALARRDMLRTNPSAHGAFWAAAILAGLPLIIARGGVMIPEQTQALAASVGAGEIDPLIDAVVRAGGMWTALGDGLFHYNVDRWPVFNAGLAALFVIGLFYPLGEPSTSGERDETVGRALAPMWLIAGVIASVMLDPERPFAMGIIALPGTYVVLALGLDLIGRLVGASAGLGWLAQRWGVVLAAIVLLAGVEGMWTYFAVSPNDAQARSDYRSDLFLLARDLRDHPEGGIASISTNPPENIPPLIFAFLPHGDRPVRWFDAATGVVIPAQPGGQPSEIDIPEVAQIPPRLERYLGEASTVIPGVRRFTVPSGEALLTASLTEPAQGIWLAGPSAFPPDDSGGVRQSVGLPVRFGDLIELVGYQSDVTREAGRPVRVTLLWRVLRDAEPSLDLAIFAHLLNADGSLAAQTDALAVHSSSWRKGDVLLQLEDIRTDDAVSAGLYHLQIGLYNRADNQRLQVMIDSAPVGDRLLLEPVAITTP